MRRAMRQLYANVPGSFASSPYKSHVDLGSLLRSASSGTDVCIRYAISYCAMRACVSGSPSSSNVWRLISLTASSILRRTSTPLGSVRERAGSPSERSPTPAYSEERKPLPPRRDDTGWLFSFVFNLLCSTMNVGRLSFMLPSPYESHDPRHGFPAFILPVFLSMIAGWCL